jgi:hypothetical protein
VISVELAHQLRDAGPWRKRRPGDRFIVADCGMDADVFMLSDITIEVHESPQDRVIGFNGAAEWPLEWVER